MIDKYNSNPNGVKIFAGETPLYWIKVKKEDSKISATILTDKIAYQLGANDMYTGFLNISSKVSNAVNLITVKNAIKNPSNIFRDRDFIEPFTLEEFKSDVISFFDKGISLKSINGNFLDCLQFVESWSYNSETQEIRKDIIGISSVKSFYVSDSNVQVLKGTRYLFYYKLN